MEGKTDVGTEPNAAPAAGVVEDSTVAEAGDMRLLAAMGYKQELRRHYSTLEVFAIAFSIMGLLPSIASTLSFSIPAGPVGMVWGWFAASIFIFIVGLAMSDLASSMPTAGGLYWWTHYFAGEKYKKPLSFLVGYSNTIGLIGGVCSVDYGFALMLLSLISIARDGEWEASRPIVYGTYAACVVCHAFIATFFGWIMPKVQAACIYTNVGLVLATVIALPIGKAHNNPPVNSGSYVFGHIENHTTWPTGWSFMLAWLSPIWTIGAFDSCVHMSEEATHAARAVPLGIMWSSGACGVLGFLCLAVIVAVIDKNLDNVLSSKFGQPMAQIYYDALGKKGALGFMSVLTIVQFFMGLSLIIAASRQSWAFSRDGALPFSHFFRHVSKRIRYQPVRMVFGVATAAIILGLLSLINEAAANALFSLAVAGNDLAWGMPIFCRLVWGGKKFRPGEFYTGWLSKPIAVTAVVYLIFAITLSMFPTTGPDPSPEKMNYTIVINGAVWVGAMTYYVLFARRWFTGPKMTIEESSSSSSNANVSGMQQSESESGSEARLDGK